MCSGKKKKNSFFPLAHFKSRPRSIDYRFDSPYLELARPATITVDNCVLTIFAFKGKEGSIYILEYLEDLNWIGYFGVWWDAPRKISGSLDVDDRCGDNSWWLFSFQSKQFLICQEQRRKWELIIVYDVVFNGGDRSITHCLALSLPLLSHAWLYISSPVFLLHHSLHHQ